MTSTTTLTRQESSPLVRTLSPFNNPRPPPSTPTESPELSKEYNQHITEKAKRREVACGDGIGPALFPKVSSSVAGPDAREDDPLCASPKMPFSSPILAVGSHFDFRFASRSKKRSKSGATVAICGTCNQPITARSGVCEKCKRTVAMCTVPMPNRPSHSNPVRRDFGSTESSRSQGVPLESALPTSPLEGSHGHAHSSSQEPPIRLSSLRPPPLFKASPRASSETLRPRKALLTDSHEPLIRPQITRKPVPSPIGPPRTPTTPPSTSHSQHSTGQTRPPSLANITTPPTRTYSRQPSVTPSELSTLYPYISSASTTTTSPPGTIGRSSTQWHNTTSAWDDWDSDEEEKAGLVRYWKVRRWRGSRGSLGGSGSGGGHGARRDSEAKEDEPSIKEPGKSKRRLVRALSCGCNGD